MEKPTKVAAGQRWSNGSKSFVLLAHPDNPEMFQRKYEDSGALGIFKWSAEESARCTFLGWAPGYGPQPDAGTFSNQLGPHFMQTLTAESLERAVKEIERIMKPKFTVPAEYRYGSFYGPSVPSMLGIRLDETPPRGDCVLYSSDGKSPPQALPGNKTALQLIQARKPPEPWRPSVTDEDLLPDA